MSPRAGLALLLLVLAAAAVWLAYEAVAALLAAPRDGLLSAGALRGVAFVLAMGTLSVVCCGS